jgi:hypothetical protein
MTRSTSILPLLPTLPLNTFSIWLLLSLPLSTCMHYCTPTVAPPMSVSHGPPATSIRHALLCCSRLQGHELPELGPFSAPGSLSLFCASSQRARRSPLPLLIPKAPRLDAITHGFRLTQRSTARPNRIYQLYLTFARLGSHCLSLPA